MCSILLAGFFFERKVFAPWKQLRFCLPRRLGFTGSLAWFVAADLLVLSPRYAELSLCESARGANRIFHFGDRPGIGGHGANCTHGFGYFQQRELVAGECGDRVRAMVRATPGESLLRDRAALAETAYREDDGA